LEIDQREFLMSDYKNRKYTRYSAEPTSLSLFIIWMRVLRRRDSAWVFARMKVLRGAVAFLWVE